MIRGLALGTVLMGLAVGWSLAAPPPGNPAEGRRRVQEIDAELKQVEQGMSDTVRELRETNKLLESASDKLEAEDAAFRQLKQELKDLEKRSEEIRKELDRRVAAVDRFSGYYETYRQALLRIEALRLQERRLSAERSVLMGKIEKKEESR